MMAAYSRPTYRKARCSLIFILVYCGVVFAQPEHPELKRTLNSYSSNKFIENFSTDTYKRGPQNWCVLQSKNGLIYVGNNEGLLEYDGQEWRYHVVPGNNVDSFAEDRHGRLFIGGSSRIGYMQRDSKGQLSYTSLLEQPDIGTVYGTYVLNDTVYFHPLYSILRWDGKELTTLIADSSRQKGKKRIQLYPTFRVNDSIYIRRDKKQLIELTNTHLKLLPGINFQNGEEVRSVLPYNQNTLLLTTQRHGAFLYNGVNVSPTLPNVSNYLKSHFISMGTLLYDSTFAFATREAGLIVSDRDDNIQHVFDKQSGILSNKSLYANIDREGSIWLAQEGGISRIQYSLPFGTLKIDDGITNAIQSYQNRMYIATSRGIFSLRSEDISMSNPVLESELSNVASWDFITIGQNLLAATTKGVFFKKDKAAPFTPIQSLTGESAYIFEPSAIDKDLIYIAGGNSIYSVDFTEGLESVVPKSLTLVGDQIHHLQEDNDGRLWIGSTDGLSSIKMFEQSSEQSFRRTDESILQHHDIPVPESDKRVRIFSVDNAPIFITKTGIFRYNSPKNLFIEASRFNEIVTEISAPIYRLKQASDGRIWFTANKKAYVATHNKNGYYSILNSPLPALSMPQTNVLYTQPGAVWYGTTAGVFIYDLTQPHFEYPHPLTSLRQLSVIDGDTLSGEIFTSHPDTVLTFNYEQNSLRFEVASNSFFNNGLPEFQYQLRPGMGSWSKWTREPLRDYTYLKEATYHFDVRTRNALGKISKTSSYQFHILPPWYRSIWAYLFYASLAVATAYGFSILGRNHGIAKAQKEYLEKEIRSAEEAQRALIPKLYPGLEGFSVAGYFSPAADVGGDHYDYIVLNDGKNHLLTLADVEGKRMSGALPATLLNGLLNGVIFSDHPPSLKQIAIEVDRLFYQKLDGKRVSTILTMLSKDSDRIELLNAGCYPPIKLTNGSIEFMKVAGQNNGPLGNGLSTRNLSRGKNIFTQEMQLKAGSFLILYSDGLRSIKSEDGVSYFRTLIGELENCESSADPIDVLNIILEGIKKHGNEMQQQDDDITMMVIKRIATT
ncbi:MAG: PP2C family protein-serine/threonine phosphatase [Calditrichia bacterium]